MKIDELTAAISNGTNAVTSMEQLLASVPFDVTLPLPTLNGTVFWSVNRQKICFSGPGQDGTAVTELDPLLMLQIIAHGANFQDAVDTSIDAFLAKAAQG